MFTELNKIDIYVFITSKPPYNTGEPKCSQNLNKIDIYVFILLPLNLHTIQESQSVHRTQ